MPLKNTFADLKHRNVYIVGAGYLAVGWILIQVATSTFPVLDIPIWAIKLVIALVAVGFPIALAIAWASEKSPKGVPPGNDAPLSKPGRQNDWRRFVAAIISVAIVAVAVYLFRDFLRGDKSIAVLPFEDLGGCADSPFFAAGVHDDVLNNLAKIKRLKVISRTSVTLYHERRARNLREIGKDLEASHILEGTVRCVEDRVIVTVKLFHAPREEQIWKNEYARIQPNSLVLQRDLAFEIASELRIPLGALEKAQLNTEGTRNQAAWVLYSQGREVQIRPESSKNDYLAAEHFYKRAIGLDPDFVLARARLSFMQVLLYQFFTPTNTALLEEARAHAEEALKQNPNSAEAHLARARCAHLQKDLALARKDLSEAVRLLPNDASLLLSAAVTQQHLGWDEDATVNYKRAAELAPLEPRIRLNYGHHLYETGQESEAREQMDRALALEPKSIYFHVVRAYAEISWSGKTDRARDILNKVAGEEDPDGRLVSAYCTLAIFDGDFEEALRIVRRYPGKTLPTVDSGGLGGQDSKAEAEGTILLYSGERDLAYGYFDSVRWEYEDAVHADQESAVKSATLALLYALMGWKESALAEASRAAKLEIPPAGPMKRGFLLGLAKAYAWAGEPELAWEQIERFRKLPKSGISGRNFRLDPSWKPLRNDPRFQSLIK